MAGVQIPAHPLATCLTLTLRSHPPLCSCLQTPGPASRRPLEEPTASHTWPDPSPALWPQTGHSLSESWFPSYPCK